MLVALVSAVGLLGCAEQTPELLRAELTLFRFERTGRIVGSELAVGERLTVAVQMTAGRVDELYLVHDERELAWRFDRDAIENARLENDQEPTENAGRITHLFEGLAAPAGENGLPSGRYRVVAYGRDGVKSERSVELRVPPSGERAALSAPRITRLNDDELELSVEDGTVFVVVRIYAPDGAVQDTIELPGADGPVVDDPEKLKVLRDAERDAERASDDATSLAFGFFEDWDLVLVAPAFR